jgi:hypothetical protein
MSLPTVIEALRKLNEPVPRPLRLPTDEEITAAERTLATRFPSDYRYYLLHGSDVTYGTLEPAVVIPDRKNLDLIEMVQTAWECGVPKKILPFCEDNGDYYCLEQDGRVVIWSHDGLFSGRWPDLADWIQKVWIKTESA